MTALTADRNTREAEGELHEYDMAAAVKIFAGALVVLDASGNAKPGVTGTGLVAAGRAEEQVDNSSGLAAAKKVRVKSGIFRFANSSSTDEITKAEIGDNCYIVDDQTVAKTSASSTRSIAGRIVDVDDVGVWVETGMSVTAAPGGSLLAANNLSDVGTKATARANLGVAEAMGTPDITVGAENATVINVGIQLNDAAGDPLAVRGSILAYVADDANGDSVAATAPDTVAIGTDGLAIPLVAGKTFLLTSEADGDIDIDFTNAAADTFYLILVMPDGKLVASDAITHAG